MILKCESVLFSIRAGSNCAWCYRPSRYGHDPAHIFARGLGGGHEVTAVWSVVPLCRTCHSNAHATGHPSKAELLVVAAKRCQCTVAEIEAAYWCISNQLDKNDSDERLAEKLVDLPNGVFRLVEGALIDAGRLKLADDETKGGGS